MGCASSGGRGYVRVKCVCWEWRASAESMGADLGGKTASTQWGVVKAQLQLHIKAEEGYNFLSSEPSRSCRSPPVEVTGHVP